MNNNSLIGSLPIYAQHLSEQTGVKVVVEGTTAYTDGQKVVVPFNLDDLPLSFGFIAHECSHVRNTDMDVFKLTLKTPFRKRLLNALEDIRIERMSMDQYPGTEEDIRYLNRKVLLEPFRPEQVESCPPLHVVHNAILIGTYWKVQEPQLEVPAKAYLNALEALLGADLAEQIMLTACDVLKCNSTKDVLGLVDAIIAMLPSPEDQQQDQDDDSDSDTQQGQDEQNQPDDQPQGQSQGGDDQEQQSEQGGDAKATEGGNSEEEGDTESEQKSSSGDEQGEGDDKGDQQDGDAEQGDGEGNDPSDQQGEPGNNDGASDLREQAMNATEADLEGLVSEVGDAAAAMLGNKAKRQGVERAFSLGGRSALRGEDASQRRIRAGIEQSSGLRQCLNGLLQAQVDCRVRLKRSGRRIDTTRIAMLPAGETRVFRSKARAERHSAAIQFLLDKSGSMREAMNEAEAALYAVLHSLENIPKVTTGAMSFPDRGHDGVERCALIKSHRERLISAVQQRAFGAEVQGCTPLAEALWPAATDLIIAKGERKILFVITDGEPDNAHSAKEMITRCVNSGIEVIGLGFGGANEHVLSRLFTHYRAIGTVANLKNALFELVRESLVA